MIFYASTCKLRYGIIKQSLLFLTHRLIYGYRYSFDNKIKLSNEPIKGSVVFFNTKSYMVTATGKETRDNGKTWKNTLSLVEISQSSLPKFNYHGNVYPCDVSQNTSYHECSCDLIGAIV